MSLRLRLIRAAAQAARFLRHLKSKERVQSTRTTHASPAPAEPGTGVRMRNFEPWREEPLYSAFVMEEAVSIIFPPFSATVPLALTFVLPWQTLP